MTTYWKLYEKIVPMRQRHLFFLISILSLVFTLFIASTFDVRGHYEGDGPSNEAAWNGGKNFDHFGFLEMRFVPIQKPDFKALPKLPTDYKTTPYYTHYPAGMDLMQGLLFRLGLEGKFSHQLIAILVSMAGAFFAWKALSLLFSSGPALACWASFVLAPNFIFFADSLHMHSYFFLFFWLQFFWLTRLREAINKRKKINIGEWALKFFGLAAVASWFSLDLVFPFLLLNLTCLFLFPKSRRWTMGLPFMLAGPLGELVGFSLHVLKNGMVLGGAKNAVMDFVNIFMFRAAHVPTHEIQSQYDFIKHGAKFFLGLHWFFTLPILSLALVGWVVQLRKSKEGFWLGAFIATILGAISWQFFMRQHAMAHAFTYRHMEAFSVLGFGLFAQHSKTKFQRVLTYGAVVLLIGHSILGIMQIEGTAVKRSLITSFIRQDQRAGWACLQKTRLTNTQELSGAKNIVNDFIRDDCHSVADDTGFNGRFAEFILYWR